MHCSCLLLFSFLAVFSDINAASAHKRGLIPTNINIDIKLGKGSTAKTAEEVPPEPGSRKTVLNAPFGLGSLTITTNRKNSTNTKEPGKPCDPDTELIENGDKKPYHGDSNDIGTLGGKGGAFFGPPHPPHHPDFGPPPPPDYHHPYPHYPPPPHSHFHHHPPPPHHHPDCHHGEFPHPSDSSTKVPLIPETKPDAKFTTAIPTSTNKDKVTQIPTSTTENVDALIDDIFNGPNLSSSTTTRTKVDPNDREQTGEGNLDIRMPKSH